MPMQGASGAILFLTAATSSSALRALRHAEQGRQADALDVSSPVDDIHFPYPYNYQPKRVPSGHLYVGCVADRQENERRYYHKFVDKHERQHMTPAVCQRFCANVTGTQFFGLTRGDECYCSPYFQKDPTKKARCDLPCAGDPTQMCGGKEFTSMYSVFDCTEESSGGKLVLWKYVEGSSWNKGLVLRNVGDGPVHLQNYEIKIARNGKSYDAQRSSMTLPDEWPSLVLKAGEEMALVHSRASSASADIQWLVGTPPVTEFKNGGVNFNGDDAVGLFDRRCGLVDQIGEFSPAVEGKSFTVGATGSTKDDRLQRIDPSAGPCSLSWTECSRHWQALGLLP